MGWAVQQCTNRFVGDKELVTLGCEVSFPKAQV